jgi:hypothetical protein
VVRRPEIERNGPQTNSAGQWEPEPFEPAVELNGESNRWLGYFGLPGSTDKMGLVSLAAVGVRLAAVGAANFAPGISFIIASFLAGLLLSAAIAFAWPVSRTKAARY